MAKKTSQTSRQLLTNQLLQKLPQGALLRDSKVRGMFVQRTDAGALSFKIQADLRSGTKPVSIRMTLGRFPEMSIEQARAEGSILLGQIKKGLDPRTKRKSEEADPAAMVEGEVWTVAVAYDRYLKYLRRNKRSDRSINDHETHFRYFFDPNDPDAPLALQETGKSALVKYGLAKKNGEQLPPARALKTQNVVTGAPAIALGDWRALPITSLTKQIVKARHEYITDRHGPVIANKVIKTLRSWLNNASDSGVECPAGVTSIKFNAERSRQRSMHMEELEGWYKRLQKRPNPLRRIMYEFALLSGLRPSNVARIQLSWIDLAKQVIKFPAGQMKKRDEFHLPLSEYMIGLIRQAMEARRVLVSKESDFLFPTYSPKGEVIATATWHEKKDIEKETGHFLRHTYSNMARLIGPENGVSADDKKALMAHTLEGVEAIYVYDPVQFPRLVKCQEIVTEFILREMRPDYKPRRAKKLAPRALESSKLLDRAGLVEMLGTHESNVEQMLGRGMPLYVVEGAERFDLKEVLEWLRAQEPPKKPSKGRPGAKRGRAAA